ncbi:MAG: hypothetical protein KDK24_01310 [Pseudooceanicola sp.]|nr:hypothetical protein [Pseudooceanicola sp.]
MIRALALILLAGPAQALSCLPVGPREGYDLAAKSDKSYVVVAGVAAFDSGLLPRNRYPTTENPPAHNEIPARIKGRSLDTNGFLNPFDEAVTLDALCLGPWCGEMAGGGDYLMFLERRGSGYALVLSPCGDTHFRAPGAHDLEGIAACFQTRARCGRRVP